MLSLGCTDMQGTQHPLLRSPQTTERDPADSAVPRCVFRKTAHVFLKRRKRHFREDQSVRWMRKAGEEK